MKIITDVEDFAYRGNLNIDYITIGEEVKKIGERAFANAPNLISVKIEAGENPIRICLDAFIGSKNLVEVSSKRETIFYKKIKYRGGKRF